MVITFEGAESELFGAAAFTSQDKPSVDPDGSLYAVRSKTGIIGYGKDGSAYWQDRDGKWEQLRRGMPRNGRAMEIQTEALK